MRPGGDELGSIIRLILRGSIGIVLLWLIAAAAGGLFVPQLETVAHDHAHGFLPAKTSVNQAGARIGALFGDGNGANLNYLVLESDGPLSESDKAYHERVVASIRADHRNVESVVDLWSDPLTAPGAVSADGKAVHTMLRLRGELGAATANSALDAVRDIVNRQPRPDGLRAYVTGPGATIADEFTAIDRQMLVITGITVALIASLLLIVYRSILTVMVPLMTVGLGLAVARALVAFGGLHDWIEVSLFSVTLLAAMMLGAVTDYSIFMLGRYHEKRRAGVAHEAALTAAYRSVAPVILGSALTIAAALACLSFAEVGLLRSAGLPCALGILVGMAASLTLLPALLNIAGRHGLAQPRPRRRRPRGWRILGLTVARWPGAVLAVGLIVLLICAIPAATTRLGFDELTAQPESTLANQGFAAADRHFPPNQLLPETVAIETDHDLRTPAGVIAIERVTRQLMSVPGVRMVQSVSRPAGTIPEQATLTGQSGTIGDQLDAGIAKLTDRLAAVDRLSPTIDQFAAAIDALESGLAQGSRGIDRFGSSATEMRSGLQQLAANATQVAGYVQPLRDITRSTPRCAQDPACSVLTRIVDPVDSVVAATRSLLDGSAHLNSAAADTAGVFTAARQSIAMMRGSLEQLRAVAGTLAGTMKETRTMFDGLTEYLRGIRTDFRGSPDGGFYMPQQAWANPDFQRATKAYFSRDGRATRFIVYGTGAAFGADGANRATAMSAAVAEATKEGTLHPTAVLIAGFGTGTAELRNYVRDDFILLVSLALTMVFLIVIIMVRSPVAAFVVIGTVVVSYLSAIGLNTLIWQHLLGTDLHWAVPSISLIALVAVGADYNLLFVLRLREERSLAPGANTAMIRTFAGTGGVVTTAGIVFGITMFAMLTSSVLSVAQVGCTIGIGLMIDTLIIRALVVPSIAQLLGRWFWWNPMDYLRSARNAIR